MAMRRSESFPARPLNRVTRQATKLGRWPTIKRNVADGLAEFFGIAIDPHEDNERLLQKWKGRSQQMYANNVVFGSQKTQPAPSQPSYSPTLTSPMDVYDEGDSAPSQRREQTDSGFHASTYPRSRIARPQSFRSLSRLRSVPEKTYRPPKQESVAKMAYDGILYMTGGRRPRPETASLHRKRSFKPSHLLSLGRVRSDSTSLPRYQRFFDVPVPTSQKLPMRSKTLPSGAKSRAKLKKRAREKASPEDDDEPDFVFQLFRESVQRRKKVERKVSQHGLIIEVPSATEVPPSSSTAADERGNLGAGMKRIAGAILDEVLDNTDRKVGVGFIGRLLNWEQRTSQIDDNIKEQIDRIASNEHRPFFTYWVTLVQIICFIVAVSVYGVSTVGVSETKVEAEVLTKSLSIERVFYIEEDNMWIGPRQADLIHLGARYSPCMRKDTNVEVALLQDRQQENATACCILNDGSGCYQSDQKSCSKTLAAWQKWNGSSDSQYRFSGSVCGQDPRFCLNPQSLSPFEWPDDITSWPVCRMAYELNRTEENRYNRHMLCPIVGRPCCVGIKGECIITTREHCTFLRGFFHEEVLLCSQISCMTEICGMIPFYKPDQPDQFYRLWTSLFIHAGIFQLLLSILFQVFIMRDLEKLAGWLRICIIYVVSGIGGSLASAIFIPYHVEAGPSGSQFGLLACLFVDVIHNWRVIQNPGWALGKLTIITVLLFVLGFLPMIDNYAHVFGFLFGFMLSFALLPYVTFGLVEERGKVIGIVVCLVVCVCLLNVLIVLFYVSPIYSCTGCQFFNCIPFTNKFCRSMEVKIVRGEDFST